MLAEHFAGRADDLGSIDEVLAELGRGRSAMIEVAEERVSLEEAVWKLVRALKTAEREPRSGTSSEVAPASLGFE